MLLVCITLMLYYLFKGKVDDDEPEVNIYSIDYLCEELKKIINNIINTDVEALNLNKQDLQNRKHLKRVLSDAIRRCAQGDLMAKTIVFQRVKYTLSNILGISESIIDEIIPFHQSDHLTGKDKFEILMYLQKRYNNNHMFQGICQGYRLDKLKQDDQGYYYDIREEDINQAFHTLYQTLTFDDKLNILTQRVYEETYGLSVVDLMIMEDDSLDGVSGGISGITKDSFQYMEEEAYAGDFKRMKTHESVWIIYQGKPIHLRFLSFQSNTAMMRICKNLSEHGRTGHITASQGGLKTHLVDGSRVVVFRPNNGSQWAFFVRKCANTAYYELKDLITDKGCEYPIGVIRWAVRGCLNLFFSGDQNSGKTTNTRAAVREIDRRQSIRTLEADFELYLNDAYSDKNILGTRPSERLPFPKLIELLKASDAHTILFGETASLDHAKHLINLLLAGTKRVITTGHWPTTDELVSYFVYSMGGYGSAGTEDVEALVSRLIHLDIHCVKENDGHRHIDRITEVIPYDREYTITEDISSIDGRLAEITHYLKLLTQRKSYITRDIVIYENGEYRMINPISEQLSNIILRNLPPKEQAAFLKFNALGKGGAVSS